MATINDIARKLGISKSTVSKGLNNATDVSESMRRKILETAVELGYVKKQTSQKVRRLCILINNMDYSMPGQFGYDIILGFRQMAEPEGFQVDVVDISIDEQRGTPYDIFMIQHDYLAAFVLGFSLLDPWMKDFKTSKCPAILYDNSVKGNPCVASIGCDTQEGFELAIRHLMQLGHKKIGLISGPFDSYVLKARYQAYLTAMNNFGLEINDDYIGIGYYVSESIRDFIPKLYNKGVTAILFSHDIRAVAAITECANLGIRVPEDLSIIGVDDLPIASHTKPRLTTLRQDRIALGKCGYYALNCLLNQVSIGSILLRTPLIVRESTGPVPKSRTPLAIEETSPASKKTK